MSWERDPLWAKARLFFARAFDQERDDPAFGLWCSFGLEMLARAALASISPTLLAEPDRDHKYLLHALGRGSERTARKSIATAQVLALCQSLFPEFAKEDLTAAIALVNRRNEELHSGAAAFQSDSPKWWLTGFYKACKALVTSMGESLETLFGEEEASIANEILTEDRTNTTERVQNRIASHRDVFKTKLPEEQERVKLELEKRGSALPYERHHRVTCPACSAMATVQGHTFGKEHMREEDGEIVVRQAVSPTSFSCQACGLKLDGYAELEAAGLGGHYTRRTAYRPEEYYGLIHPDDLSSHIEEYLAEHMVEYDNE